MVAAAEEPVAAAHGDPKRNPNSDIIKSEDKKSAVFSPFRVLELIGCLVIIGLLTAILVVVATRNDRNENDSSSSSSSSPFSRSSEREFIGSTSEVDRICGGDPGASLRLTYATTRNMNRWEVTVSESLCCNDWTDPECHILGLTCAECLGNGTLDQTGHCSNIQSANSLQDFGMCRIIQQRTLVDFVQECETIGGTVQAKEEMIVHGRMYSQDHKGQKGLVAKCVDAKLGLVWPSEAGAGIVCGTCEEAEWETNRANYMEREDCRVLNPTYPTCGQKQGAPMITSETINDLLLLCEADEINYQVTRVHPLKYGDGNERELNAYCNTIGDFSMIPLVGVTCGHCDNGEFVASGRCSGVDLNKLESKALCSTYVQTDIEKECQPGDGGGSQVGPIGAYDGNITKAVLVCCSSSNCPGNTELSGLFCGECTGPEWLDYVPYRDCSGVNMLIEPICS